MDVQLTAAVFKPADLISVPVILPNFTISFNSNKIYEQAAIWLLPHLMKKPAKTALSYQMTATENREAYKAEAMTTYREVINHLLYFYATDDIIVEDEADVINCQQPENVSTICYSETLWGRHYDEDRSTRSQTSSMCSQRDYNAPYMSL